ncbi:TPA: fertility inhibition protein FinO [Escherichia coli]|nr:fertility inhibition protein FinO [Escherichia coli]
MSNLGFSLPAFGKTAQGTAKKDEKQVNGAFYHVHWYKYPLTYWLNIITSLGCLEGGDLDIRDVLLEDVAQRNIPLSHKKLRRALKAITRSESYLCAMKAGACRYDTEGYVTEHISQEEEVYAAERLDKIRRQNRIKAELQAVLDEK